MKQKVTTKTTLYIKKKVYPMSGTGVAAVGVVVFFDTFCGTGFTMGFAGFVGAVTDEVGGRAGTVAGVGVGRGVGAKRVAVAVAAGVEAVGGTCCPCMGQLGSCLD